MLGAQRDAKISQTSVPSPMPKVSRGGDKKGCINNSNTRQNLTRTKRPRLLWKLRKGKGPLQQKQEENTMRRARDGVVEEMAFHKLGHSLADLFINILTCFSKLLWSSLHGKMDTNRIWASSI